ncbi:MAG: complex I NDUFA9 subunit family protein [Alphaproteobacteria bacterium]|nr:complex I NDUFA9 subunit family protein [Alphaproteobacteria bacterium]MCD8570347.1 complex I NDUFA9 subunit family protein [Alphaproteobacteria bacterium]
MSFQNRIVTVFGGTGFVGRQIVRELAQLGAQVKIATRVPERGYFLKPCGHIGQVVPVVCDYSSKESVRAAIQGSHWVINCIGILHEKKRGDFDRVHAGLPGTIAKACAKNGVGRFVHISALGIEKASSRYAISKKEGEKAVRSAFPKATILRPSVIFGPDDNFFNMFAGMAEILPFLPLIGGGETRFQPVYVGDVADAVVKSLTLPEESKENPLGKTYALGGPHVMSFREIYETLFRETGRRRALVALPWGIAKIQASFMEFLPNPPLTRDQVEQLKYDSIVPEGADTLDNLGITPTAADLILPRYLSRYRPGGRFGKARSA